VTKLMADLAEQGICIEVHGDRLRCSPRSRVTPALLERIRAHKGDLLVALSGGPRVAQEQWQRWWHAALDEVADHFPPDVLQALREAEVEPIQGKSPGTQTETLDPRSSNG
jgi:hypothetical protein